MSHTTLHLFKENFKFSSAHFLIFDSQRAEKLHGHNYQVKVRIPVPVDAKDSAQGYFIDFSELKLKMKKQLDLWDEHVLLPQKNSEMKFSMKDSTLEVRFRDRFYAFPKDEVVLLPLTNTSVEQLSQLLAENFLADLKDLGVQEISVMVEETRGQGASTTAKSPSLK